MNRTLQMIFRNAENRITTMSVSDPLEELDVVDVETAMQAIVDANIFQTTGGDIESKVRAQVVSREVDVLSEFN